MTLNFFVKEQLSGTLQIIAKFYHDGESKNKSTGHTVKDKNHLVGDSVSFDRIASQTLLDWRSRFNDYNDLCKKESMHPNIDQAIAYTVNQMKLNGFTVIDAFTRFLGTRKKLDAGTKKKYETVKRDLENYNAWRLKPEVIKEYGTLAHLMLDTLPKTLLVDFSNYLTFECGNANNTNKRKLTSVKTVLKFAVGSEMTNYAPVQMEAEDLKSPQSNRFPVEEDELAMLKNFNPLNHSDRVKLDAFLFVCETGLRHEDLIKITPVNISFEDNEPILEYIMSKGGSVKKVTVPLSNFAYDILQRYTVGDETPFFGSLKNANHLNAALKNIFRDAKLNRICQVNVKKGNESIITNEPLHRIISIHMGRHTYGTLMIERGAPIVFVKETMGHSKLETTMIYIRPKKEATIKTMRGILNKQVAPPNNLIAV